MESACEPAASAALGGVLSENRDGPAAALFEEDIIFSPTIPYGNIHLPFQSLVPTKFTRTPTRKAEAKTHPTIQTLRGNRQTEPQRCIQSKLRPTETVLPVQVRKIVHTHQPHLF